MKVPGLDERIAALAAALIAGDDRAAEAFVIPERLDAWRSACGVIHERRPLSGHELLACARIGMHYIAKIRFASADGAATLLLRWKNAGGNWVVADAEDITAKRSPWSDIPHYTKERANA
jgi:hypothetical protein